MRRSLNQPGQRLAENDIVASVGFTGDSFDHWMGESFNGFDK